MSTEPARDSVAEPASNTKSPAKLSPGPLENRIPPPRAPLPLDKSRSPPRRPSKPAPETNPAPRDTQPPKSELLLPTATVTRPDAPVASLEIKLHLPEDPTAPATPLEAQISPPPLEVSPPQIATRPLEAPLLAPEETATSPPVATSPLPARICSPPP